MTLDPGVFFHKFLTLAPDFAGVDFDTPETHGQWPSLLSEVRAELCSIAINVATSDILKADMMFSEMSDVLSANRMLTRLLFCFLNFLSFLDENMLDSWFLSFFQFLTLVYLVIDPN